MPTFSSRKVRYIIPIVISTIIISYFYNLHYAKKDSICQGKR